MSCLNHFSDEVWHVLFLFPPCNRTRIFKDESFNHSCGSGFQCFFTPSIRAPVGLFSGSQTFNFGVVNWKILEVYPLKEYRKRLKLNFVSKFAAKMTLSCRKKLGLICNPLSMKDPGWKNFWIRLDKHLGSTALLSTATEGPQYISCTFF
jgi:hypothetical protein